MALCEADVFISGWNGKMGQAIRALAPCYFKGKVCAFDPHDSVSLNQAICVDFSHVSAFDKVLQGVKRQGCPLVMGTTGLSDLHMQALRKLSESVPVVYDTNFSEGIHLLRRLIRSLPALKDWDVSIFESHHKSKKDTPSGTAKSLRRDLEAFQDVTILSHRGGGVRGKHSVMLASDDEVLTLTHEAFSRDIFAKGALKVAVWLIEKKSGFYSMQDVLS